MTVPEDEGYTPGREVADVDVVLRALSVVPFLMVAAIGLMAVIAFILIVVFGLGTGQPVWEALRDRSLVDSVGQILLAVLIGLVPVAIVLVASWATAHGFQEHAGRTFWTVAQAVWGLIGVGLVLVERTRQAWLEELQLAGTEWWFAVGVVAFAMILAGMRLRRAPRAARPAGE